ncbi:hypothetical protein YDYSG_09690 [Paenibacillus tyrfis]|uniref:hypothetical protein n=1 Tax=Paenibacillus tyrfis TaxID=1501230 RepID=UPI002493067C|nr:hypothetical protein [Paenibacillus tyrfis]GLI04939.1 hypothetical protein YDYSG_09690 [Paenibacillus tyrfis]
MKKMTTALTIAVVGASLVSSPGFAAEGTPVQQAPQQQIIVAPPEGEVTYHLAPGAVAVAGPYVLQPNEGIRITSIIADEYDWWLMDLRNNNQTIRKEQAENNTIYVKQSSQYMLFIKNKKQCTNLMKVNIRVVR